MIPDALPAYLDFGRQILSPLAILAVVPIVWWLGQSWPSLTTTSKGVLPASDALRRAVAARRGIGWPPSG